METNPFELSKRTSSTFQRTVDGGYIYKGMPAKKMRNHWRVLFPNDERRKYGSTRAALAAIDYYIENGGFDARQKTSRFDSH